MAVFIAALVSIGLLMRVGVYTGARAAIRNGFVQRVDDLRKGDATYDGALLYFDSGSASPSAVLFYNDDLINFSRGYRLTHMAFSPDIHPRVWQRLRADVFHEMPSCIATFHDPSLFRIFFSWVREGE